MREFGYYILFRACRNEVNTRAVTKDTSGTQLIVLLNKIICFSSNPRAPWTGKPFLTLRRQQSNTVLKLAKHNLKRCEPDKAAGNAVFSQNKTDFGLWKLTFVKGWESLVKIEMR